MNYCLKYFISFACSLLIFSLTVFLSNVTYTNLPVLKPWLWVVEKTSIEIFFRLFTIQALAILFTFAFWTEDRERCQYGKSPFRFVLTLFSLYFIVGTLLYAFQEYALSGVCRHFYAIEENAKAMATLRTELLALKAQKGYLEKALSETEEGSPHHEDLHLAYFQVLSQILHVYSQQATIDGSMPDLQENIRVARTAVRLHAPSDNKLSYQISLPFNSLTQEELERLYKNFHSRQDYVTALYFLRLLQEREPEEIAYKKAEEEIKKILADPYEDAVAKSARRIFAEKQAYYLQSHVGLSLENFYAVRDFLRRYPDDRDVQFLFEQLERQVREHYVFVQDIVDSFEMGGPRSTLLLNENTSTYREYVYLGKVVGVGSRIVVRDVAILRIHPRDGLLLYVTVPYASFDVKSNSLVFDVIDEQVRNPYLEPTFKVGRSQEDLLSWKVHCPFEAVHAFSFLRFPTYGDLSFFQLWQAMSFAREVGDVQKGKVLLYDAFKRIGAPLVFIFLSLSLTYFSLKYPIRTKFRLLALFILVVGSPIVGLLAAFLCDDLVAICTHLVYSCYWFFLPVIVLIFFLLVILLLALVKMLKRQKEMPL